MKNFIQDGKTLQYAVTDKPVKGGDVVIIGDVAGVAIADGNVGDTMAISAEGVFALPKGTAALDQGKKAYVNITDNVTTIVGTATGNTFIGYVWAKALAADKTVDVKLSF